MLGAIGGSYGGGYQLLINDIDARHRLHAIVPEYTWNDLDYSLFPNAVIKGAWDVILFAIGNTGGSGFNRLHMDPYVTQTFENDLLVNAEDTYAFDFFGYHSNRYFCAGAPIATDGGPGTAPLYPPLHPRRVNALFFQGMRDTLFNFSEAYANYRCLRAAGGDVRLLSFQTGRPLPSAP